MSTRTLEPPYRIFTVEDVMLWQRKLSDAKVESLRDLIGQEKLLRPKILAELPESFDVEWSYSRDYEEMIITAGKGPSPDKSALYNYAADLPGDVFELQANLMREGMEILGGAKKTGPKLINPRRDLTGEGRDAIARIQNIDDLHVVLAELLRIYLNTRKENIAEFVRRSIFLLMCYRGGYLNRKSLALFSPQAEKLSVHDVSSTFGDKLESIKETIFAPHMFRLCKLSKDKVIRTKTSYNTRKYIISLIEMLYQRKGVARCEELFRKRLLHTTETPDEIRKITDVFENVVDKIREFENFFNEQSFAGLFNSFMRDLCLGITYEMVKKMRTESYQLSLYPCKDYHSYLKGLYSKDCSGEHGMALDHFLVPRFFDLRVFNKKRWIGNLYMLDYSEDKCLVLDRIQIEVIPEQWKILDIVPKLINKVIENICVPFGLRLLAPKRISNFSWIEDKYKKFRMGRKTVDFGIEYQSFESSRSGRLYILN